MFDCASNDVSRLLTGALKALTCFLFMVEQEDNRCLSASRLYSVLDTLVKKACIRPRVSDNCCQGRRKMTFCRGQGRKYRRETGNAAIMHVTDKRVERQRH
jgi:hypothetical protein